MPAAMDVLAASAAVREGTLRCRLWSSVRFLYRPVLLPRSLQRDARLARERSERGLPVGVAACQPLSRREPLIVQVEQRREVVDGQADQLVHLELVA